MPADNNASDLSCADTLWKSADALRGQVDAAEYKHVVLGLLFRKYISDSFQSRRNELRPHERRPEGMAPQAMCLELYRRFRADPAAFTLEATA